jgi:diphthamide synthase subunit DPH2
MSDIIKDPGKFEGEPTYAPHFYDIVMNGFEFDSVIDGDTQYSACTVDADDVAKFPALESVDLVVLWSDSQGFVYTREMSTADWDQLVADVIADTDEDEEAIS